MKKVYKSKIGLELAIPLILLSGILLFISVYPKPAWTVILIILSIALFVVHIFTTTTYTVAGDSLTIRCSFLFNKTIAISSIKQIAETNNPLSSPATSLDRLEIKYDNFKSVLISPKHKKEFINEIISLNPKIEVKLKKK